MGAWTVVGLHFLFVVLLGRHSIKDGISYGLIRAVVRSRL